MADTIYDYDDLTRRQGEVLSVARDIQRRFPDAWARAHRTSNPAGSEYIRRVAAELRARGWNAGVNGKRGNVNDLSMDPVTFPVTSRGVRDGSGRYAQIAIIDLIGSAGGDNANVSWIDVTEETRQKGDIGAFVLPDIDNGAPSPQPGPPTPTPTPVPPPNTDALMALVRDLTAKVDALPGQVAAKVAEELAGVKGTVDETYRGIFTESDNPDTPSLLQRLALTQEAVNRVEARRR